MNLERRKEIQVILDEIDRIKGTICNLSDSIESVQCEEQDYFDNMPENMQGGEKGNKAEEVIGMLDEAMTEVDNVDSTLDAISDCLTVAQE